MLVLAMFFMVLSGMLVFSLLAWSGNNLQSVAAFSLNRSLNYSVNSAMNVAIQDVRYSTTACPSTGLQIPINGYTIDIWCSPPSPQSEGPQAASRTITFTACNSTDYPANCSSNPTSTNPPPYLVATVAYGDYSNQQLMAGVTCAATCGTTMMIESWIFTKTSI